MRVTRKDVQNSLDVLKRLCPDETEHWVIEEGSPTYGRSWRLYAQHPKTHGLYDVTGHDGYIGFSAREAKSTIDGMINGVLLGRGQLPTKF